MPKRVRIAVRLTHYSSAASLFLGCKQQGMSDAEAEAQVVFPIAPNSIHVHDAFIGMACLVCHGRNRGLALRAVVTDVHGNTSGIPLRVDVLYIDSGRSDVVGLDCVYAIDEEAAAQPRKAIACCIRSVTPTATSSRFDLKQLWKRGTLFEAVFHTASDAGVHEVDLYAKCRENNSRLKTYDVGKYLVENGFAKFVGYLADPPEAVGSSVHGVVSVSLDSGEASENGTLQRPFRWTQPSSSEAPRGRRSVLEPTPNPARPCDAAREENNDQSCSHSIDAEDLSVAASSLGTRRGRRICKSNATYGFSREEDRCANRRGSNAPADLFELVIDPVKPLRPPEVGSCVFGQVSAVVSPSCFYLVFPYGRRSIERLSMDGMGRNSREMLKNLTQDLQVACSRGRLRENRHVMKAQGELVAAKSIQDGRWYRARVVSLGEGDTINVFYMDFGFCECLPVDQVKTLEARFTHLPQQALQACLVTDKINNRLADKPTWDDHSCDAFANIVAGRDLVVKVVCVAQGLLHVRLFFTDGDRLRSVWRCLRKAPKMESH